MKLGRLELRVQGTKSAALLCSATARPAPRCFPLSPCDGLLYCTRRNHHSSAPSAPHLSPVPPSSCRDASVYTAAAVCALDGGATSSVALTAIGKFPFLSLDSCVVEHGGVLVGCSTTATLRLANQGLVPAAFTAAHCGACDGVFGLTPARGVLAPHAWTELCLTFTPRAVGTESVEHWEVATPGGNRLVVRQSGAALGADVALSARALQFGSVAVGSSVRKVGAGSLGLEVGVDGPSAAVLVVSDAAALTRHAPSRPSY